jgi:hypothetical protein
MSGIFFSCHDKTDSRTGALEIDSIQINKTEHLFGDTAKPACNITINYAYVAKSADTTLSDTLNSYFAAACFGDKYIGENPDSIAARYVKEYVKGYRDEQESMYTEDLKDKASEEGELVSTGWYSYYKTIESRVQFYQGDLMVYRVDYSEYTGGAHDTYSSTFLNMDLKLMRPLRLDDLFAGDYKDALTNFIWTQLMADNKVGSRKELEDMGYASMNDITPSENFYLDKKGITFYYNVYDIAPFVMGPTQVTLPFALLEQLLAENTIIDQLKG